MAHDLYQSVQHMFSGFILVVTQTFIVVLNLLVRKIFLYKKIQSVLLERGESIIFEDVLLLANIWMLSVFIIRIRIISEIAQKDNKNTTVVLTNGACNVACCWIPPCWCICWLCAVDRITCRNVPLSSTICCITCPGGTWTGIGMGGEPLCDTIGTVTGPVNTRKKKKN